MVTAGEDVPWPHEWGITVRGFTFLRDDLPEDTLIIERRQYQQQGTIIL